jgi:hypothetical protein
VPRVTSGSDAEGDQVRFEAVNEDILGKSRKQSGGRRYSAANKKRVVGRPSLASRTTDSLQAQVGSLVSAMVIQTL